MTKKEIREKLLGFHRFAVISYPDYNGGWRNVIHHVNHGEEIELGSFEYLEFEGNADDVFHSLKMKFHGHAEPRNEDPIDWEDTMKELLEEFFRKYFKEY